MTSMSQSHYGYTMDQSTPKAGSVKRAREGLRAGRAPPRPPPPPMMDDAFLQGQLSPPPRRTHPPPRPPPPLPSPAVPSSARPQIPAGFENGKGGHNISRPTQAPHWPLPPGSPLTPTTYRSPNSPLRPNHAPPRPARPSRIPSMVDQSRPQEPTPIFFHPQLEAYDGRESGHDLNPSTPATASSRHTSSSVGTIPEFPAPGSIQDAPMPMPQRRSANLGPPPSSRRGASSFYSNASFVSPIPEESSRSHGSYASSAAMPEAWSPASPGTSPYYGDAFYDDSVTEKSRESIGDDSGDESKLVRSASIGKKGRAALVDNKPGATSNIQSRPSPAPVQEPFLDGTGYTGMSTSSSDAIPSSKQNASFTTAPNEKQYLTPLGIAALGAAGAHESQSSPQPPASGRLSAMRRPPKLDIDAVRTAEARGSITSLPDLIKRATRLASMIEKGKRPASGLGNFNDMLAAAAQENEHDGSCKFQFCMGFVGIASNLCTLANGRHQSGLSDMLAAFPPPGQPAPNARPSRGSWFRTTSWPLMPGKQAPESIRRSMGGEEPDYGDEKPKAARKCCGMPPWAFVLVIILVLCAIAAAIVVPLQFFVFKNLGNQEEAQSSLDQCQSELDCKNGGTNVLSQGVCSCICTNGFTGSDCSERGEGGCTTTNLISPDSGSNIDDVTLGRAIPRLIADASSNFSIPLSGTVILAKINNGDLSCRAQNSLVTFQGRPARAGNANSEIVDDASELDEAVAANAAYPLPTDTATNSRPTATRTHIHESASETQATQSEESTGATTVTSQTARPTETSDDTDDGFSISEEILDFARVAVLYILQEESSSDAERAQSDLQAFFSRFGRGSASRRDAKNVTIGDENSIDLIDFRIDLGQGAIGGRRTKRGSIAEALIPEILGSGRVSRRSDTVLREDEEGVDP